MINKFLLFFILSGLFAACGSQQKIATNKWIGSNFKPDGKTSEWTLPLPQPQQYTAIQCDIANDSNNLYVVVRIPDKGLQRNIMTHGITIWIDTLLKNREKIGLGYPLPLTEEKIQKIAFEAQINGSLDDRVLDNAYANICQELELIGFVEETVRVSNLASKDLKTATAFDELGAMVCEYKIPFTHIWESPFKQGKKISIGVKVNPPELRAEDDPGLFDNNNQNPITSNNQMNPLGGLPGQQSNNQRLARNMNNNISIWVRTQLQTSN